MVGSIERANISLVHTSLGNSESAWPVAEQNGQGYIAAAPDPGLLGSEGEYSNRLDLLNEHSRSAVQVTGTVVDLRAALRGELSYLEGDDGGWIERMTQGGGLI